VLLNFVYFICSNIVVEFNSYDAGPGRLKSGLGIRSNLVVSSIGLYIFGVLGLAKVDSMLLFVKVSIKAGF
jgi:hypothetical protein